MNRWMMIAATATAMLAGAQEPPAGVEMMKPGMPPPFSPVSGPDRPEWSPVAPTSNA